MKIFISWSGDKSKEIASAFKEWIPAVVQAAKPYFSPSDIDKGARWSNEIAKELESSRIGLICLTDDNLQAPWLMFEAGALSKSMEKTRVCPMLFGVETTDLAGPLVQFQAAPFSRDEVYKVIKTVNSQLGDSALDISVLESVFHKWWPDLDDRIQKILSKERKKGGELRTDRELLEEVLKITRTLYVRDQREIPIQRNKTQSSDLIIEAIKRLSDLVTELAIRSNSEEQLTLVREEFEKCISLLFRAIPDEINDELGRKASTALEAIDRKLAGINEIPF